jgi:hypothetical protein
VAPALLLLLLLLLLLQDDAQCDQPAGQPADAGG